MTPILLTVIDTEEEFDWQAPFDKEAVGVTAMDQIELAQEIFDVFKIRPVYLVDYPIASQPRGYGILKQFQKSNRATIGAHLHPWNTPPFIEELCPRNSYPGNLPRSLEIGKLKALVDKIQESFGLTPVVYKAGRYGIGKNTPGILEELGFEVDLSPSPPFDFRGDGGPDFSQDSADYHWFGSGKQRLCLPTTGAYLGPFNAATAHKIFTMSRHPLGMRCRLPGLLARSGLLNRLRLSPEGSSLKEMIQLTKTLWQRGIKIFSFSFHSPSLKPGCTPYVRDRTDLQRFLGRMQDYFDFFHNDLKGISMTPLEIKSLLQQRSE